MVGSIESFEENTTAPKPAVHLGLANHRPTSQSCLQLSVVMGSHHIEHANKVTGYLPNTTITVVRVTEIKAHEASPTPLQAHIKELNSSSELLERVFKGGC